MSVRKAIVRLADVQQRVNLFAASLAGLALMLMMLAGAADVLATNASLVGLQSRPIPSTNEFMATMMVAAVFLGVALAQQRRGHIQVTVGHLLEPRLGRSIEVIRHLSHGLFYALIAWFGWSVAQHSFAIGEFAAGLVNFPVWPARLALALGAALMTFQCLVDVALTLLGIGGQQENQPSVPLS